MNLMFAGNLFLRFKDGREIINLQYLAPCNTSVHCQMSCEAVATFDADKSGAMATGQPGH